MYAIYGNIYHQYTPNVSIYTYLYIYIYTIHGSYGILKGSSYKAMSLDLAEVLKLPSWHNVSTSNWSLPKIIIKSLLLLSSMNTLWWTNIAMEHGHRNSGFSHENMVIFHSYVSLPEGILVLSREFEGMIHFITSNNHPIPLLPSIPY